MSAISLIGVTFAPSAPIAVLCLIPFCIANAIGRVASAEVTAARAPPGLLGSLVGLTQTFTSSELRPPSDFGPHHHPVTGQA